MSWRRKNGRAHRARSRKLRVRKRRTPVTRKSLVRLIKSVSLSTQETKRYAVQYNPLGIGSIGTAVDWNTCHNLFYDIPNMGNTAIKTDHSFIGEQIWVRGVKLRFNMTPGSAGNVALRVSILSVQDADSLMSTPGAAVVPAPWYEPSTANLLLPSPRRRFNTQKVRVLKSKIRWIRPQGGNMSNPWFSMWVPFKRKIKRTWEEDTVNETWGMNNGRDYYLLTEFYNPSGASLVSVISGNIDKIVYFKDA